MTIGHSNCYLSAVTQYGHAVDTFRHFNSFNSIQRELVEDEDAAVTRPHKQLVFGEDGAIHLARFDVEASDCTGLLEVVDIDVVRLTVQE